MPQQPPQRDDDSIYRKLFDLSPDAVFIEDHDGVVLDANDQALILHGMSREELIGRNVTSLVPPSQREVVEKEFQAWVRGDITRYRGQSLRKDGSMIPVEIRGAHVDYMGTPALLFHVRNISEQIRAEQELVQGRSRFETLVNHLAEGIWTLDSEGVGLYANAAMERILGYHANEITGKPLSEFLSDKQRSESLSPHHLLRTLTLHPSTVLFQHRDGHEVSCIVHAHSLLDEDAINDEYQLTLRDISETLNLQQQLFQAQKMEAFGRLVGGMAHDFNNLLMALMGQAELLKSDLPPDSSLMQDTDRLLEIGRRGSEMVRQLLVFSRRDTVEGDSVCMQECVQRVHSMVRSLIPKQITLTTSVPEQPIYIHGSSGLVDQVIMNLVINARDAIEQEGTIALILSSRLPEPEELDQFVVSLPTIQNKMVCLAVTDTGCGMTPEEISQIFEPFFTTKPKDKGTGLGLSTAYGLVEQHNGSIAVVSTPGKGTTFKLFFPEILAPADTPPPAAGFWDKNSKRVLLVEDDPAVRKVTTHMLKHLDQEVIETTSAEEAEEIMRDRSSPTCSVLISDIMLPGQNGVEFSRRVRESNPHLPILFVTGCSEAEIQNMGQLPENSIVLHKPFRLQQVQQSLAALMS